MEFLRIDEETEYADLRTFVGDASFSLVSFKMFADRGSFQGFSCYKVSAAGDMGNIYVNTMFGDVLIEKGAVGAVGGIRGTAGTREPPSPPEGVLNEVERHVRDIILTPENRIVDLWTIHNKAKKFFRDGFQAYLVKALCPSTLPEGLLKDAVDETTKTMRKWAKKAADAR